MPLVSVVLPAFNAAATIERAVRSILTQSLSDLELIVVDDGSTDRTRERVRGIRDERLRLVERPHLGVAHAANAGTAAAQSRWIARMDADDVAHPRRLETQLEFLRREHCDVVGSRVRIVDADGEPVPSLERYSAWINDETLASPDILALRFVEFPLVNPTILARREYFELGFRDGDFPEDYDLMLRAAERGLRFGKVPETLLDWHDSPERLTRSDARYSTEAFDRCRREHLLRGPLDGVASVDVWGIGKTGKPWLVWLRANGISVRHGYDIDERKIGATIHETRVEHPRDLRPPDGTPLVVAVGADGARSTIRPQLEDRGYVIGNVAWFVA